MSEPITTPATEAVAQSRDSGPEAAPSQVPCPGAGARFHIGAGVTIAQSIQPYERTVDDPVYRPLRIFTLDPTVSMLDGATAVLNVPYEPLGPGPTGKLIEVSSREGDRPITAAELDSPRALIGNGLQPSITNHQFHQQMVYAVASSVHATFRQALGRQLAWGFPGKLRLHPHVPDLQNAFYDKSTGSISFGFFPASDTAAGNIPPRSLVFTCLSHDIIVHEMTHALLDGLRSHFMVPTNPDVLAFHEAFADLVAIFQHFTYQEILEKEIQKSRGAIQRSVLLAGIAREFGYTLGAKKPLRSAIDAETDPDKQLKYDAANGDPYARGSVLVSAIFEAFLTIVQRKTERYVRLATDGSGVLRAGNLPPDLVSVFAERASKTAGEFLSICIRALDYCPPIDLTFGEYLRALITADRDLVPDDKWAYRETLIDAFAKRRIYPADVRNLSEDALVWRPPRTPVAPITPLRFSELRFAGDPSSAADANELRRQACALAEVVTLPENLDNFGFAPPGDGVELPCVQSIRTSRRVGPAGQVIFNLVAEVTQRSLIRHPQKNLMTEFYGGATIILDPKGEVRYTVLKHVLNTDRLERQLQHQSSSALWKNDGEGHLVPELALFRLMHEHRS